MIRFEMLRTLVWKEWLRMCKNVPAIMLLGLLVALALLIATSRPRGRAGPPPCLLVYWQDGPWIEYLRSAIPRDLPIRVVSQSELRRVDNDIRYPRGTHAIELRPTRKGGAPAEIWYRHAGSDPNVLWPHTRWFWSATLQHFGNVPEFLEGTRRIGSRQVAVGIDSLESVTVSELLQTETMGTLLLFFILFFTCCHMLVSTTSQERERGTLLAIALSPATLVEMLAAKVLFHLSLGLSLSTITVAVLRASTLLEPLFWLSMFFGAFGFISIGICVSALARTQATAGLITLSYMLGVGLVFYLSQEFSAFVVLQRSLLESYFFPLLFVTLKYRIGFVIPGDLAWLAGLSTVWLVAAAWLFQTRGWR